MQITSAAYELNEKSVHISSQMTSDKVRVVFGLSRKEETVWEVSDHKQAWDAAGEVWKLAYDGVRGSNGDIDSVFQEILRFFR